MNPKYYPTAYYPADWLAFDWQSGKWEVTPAATIREAAGGFINWVAFWLVPATCP
ncbi:MAG: hypothetical protein V4593_08045 [Pseudomonadota bacterium]